ncbi:MAG: Membrane protein insertase YidC 2 [Anaerolineales bacterium]|nr:Membrane protein insertase YidC 2 [Anaerolineales bacterium]
MLWDTFVSIFVNSLLWIYNLLSTVPGAFGLAIILFTILIRLVTWPLNASQLKSAKAMQDLQNDKDWQATQKKYEKDREKLAQEQMRIYKEKGINPFASCLPMLIQLPVIIALYQSITRSLATTPLSLLQLTRSIGGFLDVSSIIPLSSQFLWFDLSRPEYVNIPGINFHLPVLAIIVALTTYVQTKLTTPPSSGGANDQSAAMTGMMSIYMPLMLGWFALTFPSGLAVYFITSNILGIVQYAMMGKANWRNLLPGGNKTQIVKK